MNIGFKPNKYGWMLIGVFTLGILISKRAEIMNTINYLKEKTWDWRTDKKIEKLHPSIRAKVKEFIIKAQQELGIKLRVSSGYRSHKEQDKLYAKGRAASGKIVTNAKGGESYHNYGLAFDVVEIKNGKAIWNNPRWNEIADLGKSLGFSWGGDWISFKDKPHFQMDFGKSIAQLKALYKTDEYVNLG